MNKVLSAWLAKSWTVKMQIRKTCEKCSGSGYASTVRICNKCEGGGFTTEWIEVEDPRRGSLRLQRLEGITKVLTRVCVVLAVGYALLLALCCKVVLL